MKRRNATTWIEYSVQLAIILILAAILSPVFIRARKNARRTECQSNQKQIFLALQQYTADYNGHLPPRAWSSLIKPYAKERAIFRCPAINSNSGASDYFFNSRFLNRQLGSIQKPQTLILMGDGGDGSTIIPLSDEWFQNGNSPAWRHFEGANYSFVDGHVKWLQANGLKNYLRMVQP
jgi:prepilin-type processing-associated H-X9-DG protein